MTFYHNGANDAPEGQQGLSPRPSDAVRKVRGKDLCGRGSVMWYDKDGKSYLLGYFCERWDCRSCAAYKAKQWIAKAKVHSDVWYKVIDIAGSEALRKKISRRKGEYFSVRRGGESLFFSTVPIQDFEEVASSQDRESLLHDWLEPTAEEWGKNKRIRHSRGWGRSQPDTTISEEDDDVIKNQDIDQDMAQTGHTKMQRLVFVEPPKHVIDVLAHLGSRVKGDVEDLVAPPSEESSRGAMATLYLSDGAVEFLDLLASGEKDPEDRLHLAWPPKKHDEVPREGG